MNASRVGIGVVGINPRIRRAILGGIAGSRTARVAAICSRDPAKAAPAAADFGGAAYTSYADLLADPAVEVVFISTPHALHYAMARAALDVGKRVICEKPLTLTLPQAEELAAAARLVGSRTVVNFTYHSLPGQRLLARLLSDGAVGRLLHLGVTYLQARQRFAGAVPTDAILDVGPHLIDLAIWWCDVGGGGEIASVVSQEQRSGDGGVPIWMALARTTTDAHVCLQANRVAAGSRNGMVCRAVGTAGAATLVFDTDNCDVQLATFGDGSAEGSFRAVPVPPDLDVSYHDFPAFHIDRMVAAIRGEEEFPDFDYGLRVQGVIDAMQRATSDRRWVDLARHVSATTITSSNPSSKLGGSRIRPKL